MGVDDSDVPDGAMRYPLADITPSELEEWVADVFRSVAPQLDDLRVEVHDRLRGTDGSYQFDVTVRYRWSGLEFLVLVEAKLHVNPIKRELVQVLHSKVQSVGAHKGVMISTARYQQGALEFARVHGIALVTLTEGRFTFETKAATPSPVLSREEAQRLFKLPTFVGHHYEHGDSPGSLRSTLISTEYPENTRELLLAVPPQTY